MERKGLSPVGEALSPSEVVPVSGACSTSASALSEPGKVAGLRAALALSVLGPAGGRVQRWGLSPVGEAPSPSEAVPVSAQPPQRLNSQCQKRPPAREHHESLQYVAQPAAAGATPSALALFVPSLPAPVQDSPLLSCACSYDELAGDRVLKRTSTSNLFSPFPAALAYAALLPWAASFSLLEPKNAKSAGRVPKVSVWP